MIVAKNVTFDNIEQFKESQQRSLCILNSILILLNGVE